MLRGLVQKLVARMVIREASHVQKELAYASVYNILRCVCAVCVCVVYVRESERVYCISTPKFLSIHQFFKLEPFTTKSNQSLRRFDKNIWLDPSQMPGWKRNSGKWAQINAAIRHWYVKPLRARFFLLNFNCANINKWTVNDIIDHIIIRQ